MPDTLAVALAVSVAPSAIVSVADVAGAVMATLLIEVAAATPRMGVTSVGEVAKHAAPLPVSSLSTVASCAEVVEAKTFSVFAVVVSVDVDGIAVPLIVVAVAAPSTGVMSVGVFTRQTAPVPDSSEITPANCAEVVDANWLRLPLVSASPPPLIVCHVESPRRNFVVMLAPEPSRAGSTVPLVISAPACACDAAAKSPVADVAAVPSPSVVRCALAVVSSSSARHCASHAISSTSPAPAVERPSRRFVAETF